MRASGARKRMSSCSLASRKAPRAQRVALFEQREALRVIGPGVLVFSQRGLVLQVGGERAEVDGDAGLPERLERVAQVGFELIQPGLVRRAAEADLRVADHPGHEAAPVAASGRQGGQQAFELAVEHQALEAQHQAFHPDPVAERVDGAAGAESAVILVVAAVEDDGVRLLRYDGLLQIPEGVAVGRRHAQVDHLDGLPHGLGLQTRLQVRREAQVEPVREARHRRAAEDHHPERPRRLLCAERVEGDDRLEGLVEVAAEVGGVERLVAHLAGHRRKDRALGLPHAGPAERAFERAEEHERDAHCQDRKDQPLHACPSRKAPDAVRSCGIPS